MAVYERKPHKIHAYRYTGVAALNIRNGIRSFEGADDFLISMILRGRISLSARDTLRVKCENRDDSSIVYADVGDYILLDGGELSVLKPYNFERDYKPVEVSDAI